MPKPARPPAIEPTFWGATLEIAKQPSEMWVGLEPTFSSRKTVKRWRALATDPDGASAFFEDPAIRKTQRRVAKRIRDRYRAALADGESWPFETVKLELHEDAWGVPRYELEFRWPDGELEVKFGLDPETFEFNLKPVPVAWLYEPRFVQFLQAFVWDVPESANLVPSMAHGGGQFSLSAKTFLTGTLLADDIASRLDHPELSTFVLDWPNPDDRAFRATRARFAAFRSVLEQYRAGAFHPASLGTLTAGDILLDRPFWATLASAPDRMDPVLGPLGSVDEVFRTNFAFSRAVRHLAQGVDPGYWQSVSPDEDGFHPDQIQRYGEANAHRIQIAGERHVKSGEVLSADRVPAFEAPLVPAMLYDEASWEIRAQMARTSAQDAVEAVLLDVHHAAWLKRNPNPTVRPSILQDQLHGDAGDLLQRRAPKRLEKLREQARAENAAASEGRIRSDRVEPEVLFWAAWRVLSGPERAEIANEAITGFVERVENAASLDPRPARDPMAAHRHRIHPVLWEAVEARGEGGSDLVRRELRVWTERKEALEARRPSWSVAGGKPPWRENRRKAG